MKSKHLWRALLLLPIASSLGWAQENNDSIEAEGSRNIPAKEQNSPDLELRESADDHEVFRRLPEAALDLAKKVDKKAVLKLSRELINEGGDQWSQLRKKLEASGLDEKTLKTVRKALEESERGALKFLDKAMIVGPEGARDVKLFFQNLGGELAESEVAQRLWEQMRAALLEAGVGEEQIAKAEEIWKEKLLPAHYRIGVRCTEISPALRAQLPLEGKLGLVIEEIFQGSAAEKADLQVYDVLIQANGEALTEVEQLVSAVQESGRKGESVKLTVLRRGETRDVKVKPERERTEAASAGVEWFKKHPRTFESSFGSPENEDAPAGPAPLAQVPMIGSLFRGPGSREGGFGKPPVEAVEALEAQVKTLTETIEALRREVNSIGEDQDKRHRQEHHHPAQEDEDHSGSEPLENHEDHHEAHE